MPRTFPSFSLLPESHLFPLVIRVRSSFPRAMTTPTLTPAVLLLLFLLPSRAGSEGGDADLCAARSEGGPASCPISCFRPDPVCGDDRTTYWCGCPEAACAGVRVAKRGPCPVGNGGRGLVSGQAFLILHIVWLIVLGFSLLCGFL